MNIKSLLLCLAILIGLCTDLKAQKSRKGLTGNNVADYKSAGRPGMYVDPIDDTINFKKVDNKIYVGKDDKVYVKTVCLGFLGNDSSLYLEYYKDISYFLDIKTYKERKDGFFETKGSLYMWWGNSDGDYPIEVVGADPATFVAFDSVAGGTDKYHVFYGGPPEDFEIIQGANPKSIKVLNPENGCWNCGNCYFVDKKSVYYGFVKIEGADPKTFKLLNQETVDAEDKNGKYFEGQLIN